MKENWENFVHSIDGEIVFFFVNSAFSNHAPLQDRPYLLIVRFRPRRGERLAASAMLSFTHECEDIIETITVDQTDALYVGRITASGVVSLHFYTSHPEKVSALLETSPSLHEIAEFQFETRKDTAWDFYRSSLLPDDWIKNQIENEKVRQSLQREGDDGVKTREIQHYAYFATLQACETFQNFVLERKYFTDFPHHDTQLTLPFLLRFSKVQRPNEIDQETWILTQKAEEFLGSYDGWETPVIRQAIESKNDAWSLQNWLSRLYPFGKDR